VYRYWRTTLPNLSWKYYQFNTGRKQVAFVGSANFTTAGMGTNGEVIVKITDTLSAANKDLKLESIVDKLQDKRFFIAIHI
jgi:phosphatidylserine/phosphatidylglycerophosphate/cardiolipin synthase-like enzyme